MLLRLVMDYGLTLFYLANSISNDIHCVHSLKQQDILPMLKPTSFPCFRSDSPIVILHSLPKFQLAILNPHLSLALTRCCP
ncbi:hypothetical protein DA391_11720 [Yersinia massiliensis]|uniref:Uncharacterized protein n=1 Tax=Yersinia massiliensis TaxID=419257 RepID=A0ABM6UTP8_9GAMM|nr:hypothetical protein DA391_11720 [Yersinia massiliensis]